MKYSKKVREEAAMICSIAASNEDYSQAYASVDCDLPVRTSGEAYRLAMAAWRLAFKGNADLCDAEAEALIRTGWSPEDEP